MDDLISRQAAIDAVLSVIPYDEYWEEQVEIAVNNLPSIEQKKGKWESGIYRSVDHHTGETYRDGDAVICSVCRNGFKKAYVDPRWNYCPNCGVKMEK